MFGIKERRLRRRILKDVLKTYKKYSSEILLVSIKERRSLVGICFSISQVQAMKYINNKNYQKEFNKFKKYFESQCPSPTMNSSFFSADTYYEPWWWTRDRKVLAEDGSPYGYTIRVQFIKHLIKKNAWWNINAHQKT